MWIANDKDGTAWSYVCKPIAGKMVWAPAAEDAEATRVPEFDAPGFIDDGWKDTAREVPSLHDLAAKAPVDMAWLAINQAGQVYAFFDRPRKCDNGVWEIVHVRKGKDNMQYLGHIEGRHPIDLWYIVRQGGAVTLHLPPKDDEPRNRQSLYLDLMQRLANAVESGKLPADTFQLLWGDTK